LSRLSADGLVKDKGGLDLPDTVAIRKLLSKYRNRNLQKRVAASRIGLDYLRFEYVRLLYT